MSDMTTVAAIVASATSDGEWVNGPFDAVVRNAKAKSGNKPAKADLVDPTDGSKRILCAFYPPHDPFALEGKTVRISGRGMKAKTYKGAVEMSLGDKASVEIIGNAAPAPASSGGSTPSNPAPSAKKETPAEHAASFHKEMKKIALLHIHAQQYATDVADKLPFELTDEQRQSLVSSLFITAKDRGLLDRPPAPRKWIVPDGDGPITVEAFVPPAPDPEAEKKKREAEAAAAAEAERKRKEEEEKKRAAEQLDEDVPF